MSFSFAADLGATNAAFIEHSTSALTRDHVWRLATWIFFGVLLSLLHVIAGLIFWKYKRKPVPLLDLFRDGSLFFFAAPVAAGAYGETYLLQSFGTSPGLGLAALASMMAIVLVSALVYPMMLYHTFGSASGDPVVERKKEDIEFLAKVSLYAAIASVLYGVFVTAYRV